MDNKNKFIKVHNSDNNAVELYNVNFIMTVYVSSDVPCICLTDATEFYCNETPNRIFDWVKDSGFIKVHSRETNCICIVNVNYIKNVYQNDYETIIAMEANESIDVSVNETPEKIFNMIEMFHQKPDQQKPEQKKSKGKEKKKDDRQEEAETK